MLEGDCVAEMALHNPHLGMRYFSRFFEVCACAAYLSVCVPCEIGFCGCHKQNNFQLLNGCNGKRIGFHPSTTLIFTYLFNFHCSSASSSFYSFPLFFPLSLPHSERHRSLVAHSDHRLFPRPHHAVCHDSIASSEPYRTDPTCECVLSPPRVHLRLVVHVKHQHGCAEHQQQH